MYVYVYVDIIGKQIPLSITARRSGLCLVSDLQVKWSQNEWVCIPTVTSDSKWQWQHKLTSYIRPDLWRSQLPTTYHMTRAYREAMM